MALNETGVIEADELGLGRKAARGALPTLKLDALEACAVREALCQTGGNITQAAGLLGVVRDTLAAMMKRHGIDRHEFSSRPASRPGRSMMDGANGEG